MFELVLSATIATMLWSVGILIALGFITYFAENSSPGRASLIFVAMLIALQGLSPIQPFSMLLANPIGFLGVLILYVGLGAVYGVVKWYSYVRAIRDQFLRIRAERLKLDGKTIDQLSEGALNDLNKGVMLRMSPRIYTLPPQIADNKARFTTWMCYWPLSAAWTVLNDPVRRIFNGIYDGLATHLQQISDKMFSDLRVK